jgi:hypothetical protein
VLRQPDSPLTDIHRRDTLGECGRYAAELTNSIACVYDLPDSEGRSRVSDKQEGLREPE